MDEYEYIRLSNKVRNKTATSAEEITFHKMVLSGRYEHIDEQKMRDAWTSDAELTDRDKKLVSEIHAGIEERISPKMIPFTSRWTWLAAAASVILLAVIGLWLYQSRAVLDSDTLASTVLTVAGPNFVHLPDGSIVKLRQGATISYDEATFGRTDRRLTLAGTAYFDVTHDPKLKFQVHSGRVITTVHGTAFSVDEEVGSIKVTVERGKVAVGDSIRVFDMLTPGEQMVVTTGKKHIYVKRAVNPETEIKWKDDYFILDNVTMAEAAKMIEKRFDVKVLIKNDSLKACPIEAWFFHKEGLKQVVDGICEVRSATAVFNDRSVVISGGGCGGN